MEAAQTHQPMVRPFPGVDRSQPNKTQEIHRIASELFRQQADWVTFFRRILGVDGVVRQMFPTPVELLAKLRERGAAPPDENEPTRVITVRLPKSLHESLRTEAHEKKTSMNKLCISKLLQMIDKELIPSD